MKSRELEIKQNWNKARKTDGFKVAKMTVDAKKNPTIGVDPYGLFRYDDETSRANEKKDTSSSDLKKILALPEPKRDQVARNREHQKEPSKVSRKRSEEDVESSGPVWRRFDDRSAEFDSSENILDILD